jgi:hypothetical protein
MPKDQASPSSLACPQDPARIIRKIAARRGPVTNPAVRFDTRVTSPFEDGWDTLGQEFSALDLADLP